MGDILDSWHGITLLADASDALGGASQFVFFQTINQFLRTEIDIFQWNLLTSTMQWVGIVAMILITIWIIIQGYRIITGQSREPMMALVGDSLRAVLVVAVATGMAYGSSTLYWTLTDGTSSVITELVAGTDSPFQSIDNNLAGLQLAMSTIDALDTGNDAATNSTMTQDKWFTGIGIAGPGVIAGAMLLLNKIALALFIGFGPLFILCLLFPQTKSLFSRWLLYGIGTEFSLAVLSVMVGIAMKMISAVTATFIASYLASMGTGGSATDGINSMALQQGGLGLLLSTLIVMAPPIAAAFFQGTLGQFAAYSSFGNIGAGSAAAHRQQQIMMGQTPAPMGALAQLDPAVPPAVTSQAAFANHAALGPSSYAGTSNDVMKSKDFNPSSGT